MASKETVRIQYKAQPMVRAPRLDIHPSLLKCTLLCKGVAHPPPSSAAWLFGSTALFYLYRF